jgi:ankyrin repeat protein
MFNGNAHLSTDEKNLIKAVKETGDAAQVRRLLAAGVGVDTRDCHNMPSEQTPLMLAAKRGFLEIVEILLSAGASVSAIDKTQGEIVGDHQPLHYAVMGQNRAIVEAILNAGADVNALDSDGDTPLNSAVAGGNLDLVQLLLDRGAAVTKFGRKRYTPPLLTAAGAKTSRAAKLAIINLLLKSDANPNETDRRGTTPIQLLTIGHDVNDEGRLECLAALLKGGAKDTPSKDLGTALHAAALYSNVRAARLLLDTGSNPNELATRGTILDIFEQNLDSAKRDSNDERARSIQEFVDLLISGGAKRKGELPATPSTPSHASASASSSALTAPKAPPVGIKHFLKLANNGQPEWTLLAVRAPLGQVSDALAQLHAGSKLTRQVDLKSARNNDELAKCIALVQIKDNLWTVVLRSLYYVPPSGFEAATDDANSLSAILKTQAISFAAHDMSGAMQFDLFEKGNRIEQAQWCEGAAFSVFASTRRKQPKLTEVTSKFADKTFADLGIYLPACYPRGKGKSLCLCVEKSSAERLTAANLIELT